MDVDISAHNIIADMSGVDFLLFYGCIITITLLTCWKLVKDPTKNQPLPLIPHKLDAYEIAYLRSGVSEVAKVVIFNLIQSGYLQLTGQRINRISNQDDLSQLKPIECEMVSAISYSYEPKVFISSISQKLEQYCTVYKHRLNNEQLLYLDNWQKSNITIVLIGAIIIFGLGAYKLLLALAKRHHNIGFLIAMGVVSTIFLLWLVTKRSRISYRGQAYLQQLQQTFVQLKTKVRFAIPSMADYSLAVGVFGVETLAGTSYDSYYKLFFPPQIARTTDRNGSSDSSGGGSYCSSSSSCNSSSSCSSGNSCGGGGCGGCGGGGGD